VALRRNVVAFHADSDVPQGLAGLARYTRGLAERAAADDETALAEAYTFGWSMQGQAALHGELLIRCGRRWREPRLAEAGRLVQRVAHAWTGVRVGGAHGRRRPREQAERLARHGALLRRAYERAVDTIGGMDWGRA
jgi:hypothetical protein